MATESDEAALALFAEHNGTLRTKRALALGIHPRTLYRLRDEGRIERVSRGVYRLASLATLSNPDLATVALRVPRAVVCLISALDFHGLTTEIPREVQIALPRGTRTPSIDHPPIRVFRFSGEALTAGIMDVDLDEVSVRIYDPAKTVVDCFRFRNKLGMEVVLDALTRWRDRRMGKPADLLRYARLCRVERVMLPYLEAML
ncbi:MAG: type IV toxin-antitoxin system AbiEi family antitoxin domain-containing protein [Polyangia bacterium]|nr:type IV toxin-antitoxin system AbiEi family antitoxin domain-containing protein [Polyangia bacterium]